MVIADVIVWIGVRPRDLIDEQGVTLDIGRAVMRVRVDFDEATIGCTPATTSDRFRHNVGTRVRSHVHHLGAGVLVLAFAGHRDRENLAAGVRPSHPHRGILHRNLGSDVAVDPLHGGALFALRALGD